MHLTLPTRLCLVIVIAWSVSSSAADLLTQGQLRVISYNIQFLPGPAALFNKRGQPDYRAREIGRQLTQFDVIGLNELFETRPQEQIISEIQAVWGDNVYSIFSPKIQPDKFTGGLAIISRFPFLETNIHTYTHSSSPQKYGILADGFATKGVLHARIALSSQRQLDQSIDVFVTHLEAREPAIRPSQYAEMAQFVQQHSSPRRPAILLGDFNTRGGQAEMADADSAYHQMLRQFQQARPDSSLIDLWPAVGRGTGGTSDQQTEEGGQRIDYIFVLNPQSQAPRLQPQQASVNRFLDPQVVALSDHSAVEGTLVWLP